MINILLTKKVITKWNGRTKQYYIDKGYQFTKIGDELEINVFDLKPYSEVKVEVQCDYCGKKYTISYASYLETERNGKIACKQCAHFRSSETVKERYGVDNIFQVEQFKEKSKETIRSKYGVDNISQLPETQKKIKQNNLDKYGVTNTSKLDVIKEKVIASNRKKFGVDYPMQLDEFQNRVKQTDIQKYGVLHHTQSPDVIAKRKKTNHEKYGVEFPIQNKDILYKSISTRYKHGNFTCSTQQYQLHQLIGGELNYPFKNFVIDVAFPDEKIAVEWDGSGHDMSVRMGRISNKEFKRNENYRNLVLFNSNWKIIRFITKKDIFPDNILDIFNYCKSYIDNGGHKITVFIDENQIHFKNQYIEISNLPKYTNSL